jgi:hypothetical protein
MHLAFRKPEMIDPGMVAEWLIGAEFDPVLVRSWVHPAGWSLLTPLDWLRDPNPPAEGFLPPSRVGRLTVLPTAVAMTGTPASDEAATAALRKLAQAFGIGEAVEPISMTAGGGHRIAAVLAKSGRMHVLGVVHLISPGITVSLMWQCSDYGSKAWRLGAAVAGSIQPSSRPASTD